MIEKDPLLKELRRMTMLKEQSYELLKSGLPSAFAQSGLPASEKSDLLERLRRTAERQEHHLQMLKQLVEDIEKGGIHVR